MNPLKRKVDFVDENVAPAPAAKRAKADTTTPAPALPAAPAATGSMSRKVYMAPAVCYDAGFYPRYWIYQYLEQQERERREEWAGWLRWLRLQEEKDEREKLEGWEEDVLRWLEEIEQEKKLLEQQQK